MKNPYTVLFGKKPALHIDRIKIQNEIIEDFESESPNSQIYMITGVRGTGKTVLLTSIVNHFEKQEEWIVIDINPKRDILNQIATAIYTHSGLHPMFVDVGIDLSAFGIGVKISNTMPIADIEIGIEQMMKVIKKAGKRIFIAIDEAVNNEYMQIFASSFQLMVRHEYPVCLLMTGLYREIYNLQSEKALTFLTRAPRRTMEALNYSRVRENYMKTLGVGSERAEKMTALIKGYSYAFQVLGYLVWDKKSEGYIPELEDVIPEFDQYMSEYVYEKIWSELSEKDREILVVMAEKEYKKIVDIRNELGMTSSAFSTYRTRLLRQGIVGEAGYGCLAFTLPRFAEFVKSQVAF